MKSSTFNRFILPRPRLTPWVAFTPPAILILATDIRVVRLLRHVHAVTYDRFLNLTCILLLPPVAVAISIIHYLRLYESCEGDAAGSAALQSAWLSSFVLLMVIALLATICAEHL